MITQTLSRLHILGLPVDGKATELIHGFHIEFMLSGEWEQNIVARSL